MEPVQAGRITQQNEENLKRSFRQLKRDASAGIDGVSFSEYQENLEENIHILVARLKQKNYRAKLVRRLYIPKTGTSGENTMSSCQRYAIMVAMMMGTLSGLFTNVRATSQPDEKAAEEKKTPEGEKGTEIESITEEELLFMEIPMVITASRKEKTVNGTPAAVYVIIREDIKRSGARTIPDVLRMVPGMEVAQIDSNKWAVSSRGFNGRFAKKLLVLIDGRSVYTPLFSGVYWDVQDTLLEDMERIIRGAAQYPSALDAA